MGSRRNHKKWRQPTLSGICEYRGIFVKGCLHYKDRFSLGEAKRRKEIALQRNSEYDSEPSVPWTKADWGSMNLTFICQAG